MSKGKQPAKPQPKAKLSQESLASKAPANNTRWMILGLVALVFAAYVPSLLNGFTNWDDQVYVTESDLIKSFSSALLTTPVAANYHPLTMVTLAMNYAVSGLDPLSYHLVNLLLHLANTLLVYYFILLLTDRKTNVALITAALFGVHPMHVESVAWVAERKDVLFLFFFLAALVSYLRYYATQKIVYYVGALVLFVLSLLSKSQAVVLPVILMLVDYFMKRPINTRGILEKAPFFALAVLFGIEAIMVQKEFGAIGESFNILQKTCFASYSLLAYVGKLIVPWNMAAFYPYPPTKEGLPMFFYAAPFVALALLGTAFWMFRKNRAAIFGILFFIVPLALVLQFISVGSALMADRYTYLPHIGLAFMVGWAFQYLKDQKHAAFTALQYGLPVVVLALAAVTYQRCQVWKDPDTLWTDEIAKFPTHSTGHYNRAHYLDNAGEYDRALVDYTNAIAVKPNYYDANYNLARLYFMRKKDYPKALEHYSKAIEIQPTNAEAWLSRGNVYFDMNDFEKAMADFSKAIEIKPNYELAYFNRGNVYVRQKAFNEAIVEYTKAIEINPQNKDSFHNRSVAYGNLNNKPKALEDENQAIKLGQKEDKVYMDWLRM